MSCHPLTTDQVVRFLAADLRAGLSVAAVRSRQAQFGLNCLTAQRRPRELRRFLLQFHQPLLYLLLAASAVTLFLGEWVDASVIFGVVLVNAVVGYVQEAKAERSIEALAKTVLTEATVRREGHKQRVLSQELVPGDIVLLQSGDRVPADLRLTQVHDLRIDESALTGESMPVEKDADVVAIDTILAERANLAFAGTLVTCGQAEGVVWGTGNQTETGRIARLISAATDLSTPLTRQIAQFSKMLLVGILGLAGITFLVGIWRGLPLVDAFMSTVALAVGAIPEGLPAAVTITLAIGAGRMARRRAIIRKLPAVETLGGTTVICSDKTGTLTENQMTVQQIFAGGSTFEVTGVGYERNGEILSNGRPAQLVRQAALHECLLAGLLCNEAQLTRKNGRLGVQGDPTEGALIVSAQKAGLEESESAMRFPRLDAIPFASENQYMATLHAPRGTREHVLYVKGAPGRLLQRCVSALGEHGQETALDIESVRRFVAMMASQSLRVLAFARRSLPADQPRLTHADVVGELTFLGLQAMMDPPRAEAVSAVRQCQRAGIKVKMITGDHALTARAIAHQVGLNGEAGPGHELVVVTGKDLESLSDKELESVAERADVLARVAPEQKLRVVKALQARGHVVAMTGDGVNDAPALKQADIGVAMGISGTDVAKGAAEMLLTDDNFATIEAAIEEGRNVFDNLTKFILWTLPANFGQGLIILAAVLAGVTLPIQPVQLLWVNMTTVLLLGLMLVFEPKECDLMQRPPRNPTTAIMTFAMLMRIGLVSTIMLAGAFGLFVWEQAAQGASVVEARTIAVNVVVVVLVFYLLNCRSLTRSMFSVGAFSNLWIIAGSVAMLAAQLAFTYTPAMNRLFHTAPISTHAWLHILGIGVVAYALVEMEKWIRRRWVKSQSDAAFSPNPRTSNAKDAG